MRKERWREEREAFGLFINYFTLFQKLKISLVVTRLGYHEKVSMNHNAFDFCSEISKIISSLTDKMYF